MNGKHWMTLIAAGLVAYGVITLLPDIRRYVRISTM